MFAGRLKTAEELATNEDQTTVGTNNLYVPPPGRESGTRTAFWGENPHPDPSHNGAAPWNGSIDTTRGFLARQFDGAEEVGRLNRQDLGQNLAHATGDFETHSVLLRKTGSAFMEELEALDAAGPLREARIKIGRALFG